MKALKTSLILFCVAFSLSFSWTNAQFVTINDTAFANWLNSSYPMCMAGNQMDTTCAEIVSEDGVDISFGNVVNLDGIQYFDSLVALRAGNNSIATFPTLPPLLRELNLSFNAFSAVGALPAGLRRLHIDNNNLATPPASLPDSLEQFTAWDNQFSTLPPLPNTLRRLELGKNLFTSLPQLPNGLTDLSILDNLLTAFPTLPASLRTLDVSYNSISSIPTFPPNLHMLAAKNCQLTSLPALPDSLYYLSVDNNQLSSLPSMDQTQLRGLYVYNNNLTSLPSLPPTLKELIAFDNQIASITNLPTTNLRVLYIRNNSLTCIPTLPDTLTGLNLSGNPLTCIPNYPRTPSWVSIPYPLCQDNDPINNPNACPAATGLWGNIYQDSIINCLPDSGERSLKNIPVKLYDNSNSLLGTYYSLTGGQYFFDPGSGSYRVEVDTLGMPFGITCTIPGADSSVTLNTTTTFVDSIAFAVDCKPGFDLAATSAVPYGWVFPGQRHRLVFWAGDMLRQYNLSCPGAQISGTVRLAVNGPVSYNGQPSTALTPMVNGDTLTYSVADFSIANPLKDFDLYFQTDTTAQAGDSVCLSIDILPLAGDRDSSNNHFEYCYPVVNSYDPNDKQVVPSQVEPGYEGWLTYTIRFQNTGTAPAFNIRLRDTLSADLDLSSFQMRGYSHKCEVALTGNHLNVLFRDILLPDSSSSPEGSQGFFQFRIRPIPGLQDGSVVTNRAGIYFDFNEPIITNYAETNFQTPVSARGRVDLTGWMRVFPNPGTGHFTVQLDDSSKRKPVRLEVFDGMGRQVLERSFTHGRAVEFELDDQPNGVYVVKLSGGVNGVARVVLRR